jgi:hypothetical protein
MTQSGHYGMAQLVHGELFLRMNLNVAEVVVQRVSTSSESVPTSVESFRAPLDSAIENPARLDIRQTK